MALDIPGQDLRSKAFFQKQWHRPLHRFGKIVMPIVVSSMLVFSLFFGGIVGLSWFMMKKGDPHLILLGTFMAVAVGTFLAVLFHVIQRRRQSRFVPILLRKNKE